MSKRVWAGSSGDLRCAAGVVAVYAKIAGGFADAALMTMTATVVPLAFIWRNLRRLKLRQLYPLGDMLIANEVRKAFTVSEKVAIGRAVEEKLGERRGRPKDDNQSDLLSEDNENRDYSPTFIDGRNRDIAASRAGFDSGKQYERAKTVVDRAVPQLRDAVDAGAVSEKVAIGRAVEEKLGNRQGQRSDLELVENFPQVDPGQKTRDLAASRAGFGNSKTYEQAKTVVDHAVPQLRDAVEHLKRPGAGRFYVHSARRPNLTPPI